MALVAALAVLTVGALLVGCSSDEGRPSDGTTGLPVCEHLHVRGEARGVRVSGGRRLRERRLLPGGPGQLLSAQVHTGDRLHGVRRSVRREL